MGYVHDTHMSLFIPPVMIQKTAGTWTPTIASNLTSDVRTAADANFTLLIPINPMQNGSGYKGARLKSVDVFFKIATAAMDDIATVALDKISLPSDGSAAAGAAVSAFTLDSGNDTAAERKAAGDHTLTLTLTTPVWIGENDHYVVSIVVDGSSTGVFSLFGARANFDLRV
jgi:hypothetical protein